MIARAIELAIAAGADGNRPFGAVLVAADGRVLGEGGNEADSTGDVTAHAEIVAIRRATAGGLGRDMAGSVMYASGEPCPMCATACVWAGVTRIVFAASTAAFAPVLPGGEPSFGLSCAEAVATADVDVVVDGPVAEEAALAAMRAAIGV